MRVALRIWAWPMFTYDEPVTRGSAGQRSDPPASAARAFDLGHLIRLLMRRALWIAGAALACAVLAVIIGKSMTPKFAATAQLYVDPRELQLVERELTPRSQDQSGLAMVVESQVRLMTSSSVLEKVVTDLKLKDDPEFGGKSSLGLMARLFSFGSDPKSREADEMAAALDLLRRHITVKRTDRTFIVDIEATSRDAAKSAMLANAVADAYLVESRESQAAAARRATVDLSGRLKELQGRLRTAENNLAVYKAQNNFVGSQDTQVSDQQLLSSTQRLANAQAATLDAKARYSQIEASRKNASDPGAIPEALQSPTIANLRTQFAEARRKQAELLGELGPLHPAIRMADKQVEDLRRTINEELARFAQAAKNDITRAQDLEASLTKALDGQKRQSADLGTASVKLRELERDVEANSAIYQSFLKRSRETEEQESLNTSNARIISAATTPQRRIFPPGMSLLAMVGFTLGAITAAGCIILFDQFAPAGAPLPGPRRTREPANDREGSIAPIVAAPVPQAAPVPVPAPVAITAIREPVYVRLQEADVLRTLNGIFPLSATADLDRLGWPMLRPGAAAARFSGLALRMMQLAASEPQHGPVTMAAISIGCDSERTTVTLNIALAAARSGKRVLVIDADRTTQAITKRLNSRGQASASPIALMSGVAVQRLDLATGEQAVWTALETARRGGQYDLILLDGPSLPPTAADSHVLGAVDGLFVTVPDHRPSSEYLQQMNAVLNGAERRLAGIVFSELGAQAQQRQSA